MSHEEYKHLVQKYKASARSRWKTLKVDRKLRRKSEPITRWLALYREDWRDIHAWKKRIKNVKDDDSRKAQKKGYKTFKKLQRRKFTLGIPLVILVIILLLFARWYFGATKPLNAQQKAAREHSLQVARDVQSEGMVLLRNENNTLPLNTKKVSVFGSGAALPVFGGGGAGGISTSGADGLFDALKAEGIEYDTTLYNLYSNFAYHKTASAEEFKKPNKDFLDTMLPSVKGFLASATPEMPVDNISDKVLKDSAEFSNTAVYVISRVGTETKDLKPEDLRLNDDERATLQKLDANFDRIVLLVNTTNAMELGFVEEFNHIDAVLWIGAPGEVGMHSVAKALTGEVNPSGKLTDTYAYNIESNPAVSNTGDFNYIRKDGTPTDRYFAKYKEDIYMGYRYYETFVADSDYSKIVQYPFGYGLSYTNFDWDVVHKVINDNTVTLKVRVTNTGTVAGKDVVQLYYGAPYTPGGIEKSATVLGDYTKTKLLQPGESQDVTVAFAVDSMASYDAKNAKAWVLDTGQYDIRLARDVRTSVASFTHTVAERKVINTDVFTGAEVTNRFDHAAGNETTFLTRANPDVTKPVAPSDDEKVLPDGLLDKDYKHVVSGVAEPITGAKNDLNLKDLKGLDYDDPKWQLFLDQFSDKELVEIAGNGGYWSAANKRLGVPKTTMYDGPASVRNFLQAWASVAYPVPVVMSATWNEDLIEEIGRSMGAEARSFNVDAVYAPSINLHRSPLGGRNFEYPSEDPLVAGNLGAAFTRGLQSQKVIAVMKHYAANDQETNRAAMGLYTWMTEQSLRELYLKPFEITVKQGRVHGVMTAFNRIGYVWAGGDKSLNTDVLRDEWGFRGFVVTDAGIAGQGEHFDALQAVESGNDLMLAFLIDLPNDNAFEKQLKAYLKEDRAGTLVALRNSAHNICYYVLQTSKLD